MLSLQVCRSAGLQVCRSASLQVCSLRLSHTGVLSGFKTTRRSQVILEPDKTRAASFFEGLQEYSWKSVC